MISVVLLTSLAAVAADVSSDSIQSAKTLLAQGQRRAAIASLDRVAASTKSKKKLKELADKRELFAQQFLTSEAFQKYQEAKGLAEVQRWDDCLRELVGVAPGDQDNLLILRMKALCHLKAQQFEPAGKALDQILELMPNDIHALYEKVELALMQKAAADATAALEKAQPHGSAEVERYAIYKARILALQGKLAEAADVLKQDQETNLDHVEVLYELGMAYSKLPSNDWQARKMLSLFVSRCKRMKDNELKARGLTDLVPKAQATLAEIDKKLGV